MCVNAHSRGEMAKSRCTFSVHVGVGLNSGVMYTPISVLKPSYFSPLPRSYIMPPLCTCTAKYAKFNFPTKMWPSKLYVTNDRTSM